ncbi:fibrocystin isoform X13 [Mus pahari]|uniref:fibrocystin isoform X13 n=1 Tax=Mus pahari TaxID=10093 RepID=UPI001114766D|nr:fibrocystin isoform X13 [Mus pahari]
MMPAWLVSLLSMEVLLLAKPYSSFQIEPAEGSLAGGTWITVVFDGLDRSILYHNNGSQLEIDLVSVAIPTLRIPCDVSPVFLFADLPVVTCQTRSLSSEAHAGPYSVEISFGEQVLATPCPGSLDSCTFKFSKDQTPVLYQVFPASGVPGAVVHVYGRVITNWLETFDPDVDYIESPLILEAGGDKWLTPCSLINRQTGSCFPIQEEHGLGTVQCRVEGDYIGSQNVSFSVFNKGRSMVHKEAWLISAKQELFLYQTYPEILSVFPKVGSLGGRTDIIITGDFFDPSARVTIAGIPCDIRHVSPRKIECTTRAPGNEARLTAPQAGNRGLRFEVGDATKDEELTEATPGYRWQIVPNASSPSGFWSKEGRPFRARLSGFFVAPEINNYTFWIQADSQASLCFSSSEEPRTKVEVASVGVGTADWLDSWEQIRHEGSWHQKTAKLELQGGAKYYLEAEQHGIAPSRGMRIGVQIHNTWLNPDVVNTYLLEKHQIRARAQRLPDIQVLNVSGKGNFFLTWGNVSSQPVPANATAQQIQTTIEELLMVKCNLEPLSARVLLRLGFEQGLEGSRSDGVLTSSTEPFCGRFSLGQLGHLTLIPEALDKGYQLDRYPYLCLAYRGHMNKTLGVTVSFLSGFQNITKNITCDWNLTDLHPESWQFTCINLWDTCVRHSEDLQSSLANTPLLVHRIDIRPMVPEAGLLYVDEIILADTNVTVSQADSGIPCPGGNVVESVSVVGVPPVYTIASWLAGCGSELPLITACYVSTEETGDGSELVEVTAQRLQRTSPPLGGHFFLYLSDTVIPDVPVHMSARQLHKLLQDSADESTSGYVNAGDFTVTEDLNSCYEHVWTLSWTTQIGDLPNFIRVSDQNLTGVSPAVTARVVHDGGVFLGPIFGDMLATANQQTQVAVQVNDIPAYCSGSCSFQYQQESTPSVDHVCYSLGNDVSLLVHFTGTGFPRDPQFLQVTVNKTSCEVIFSNETNVACELALLPVGEHRIFMLVIPSGLAVNASGEDLFLHVEPRLDAVEPSTAAEIGGQWVTLRGSSLEGVSLVLFGTQSCIIDVIRSNSQQIQCKVPPKGKDGYTVNVTVISGDHSTVLDRAFTYVSSLNPVIVSLSRNRSNIAGGEILFLGMSLLVNYTDLDVQIYVQDASSQVLSQTVWGLEVVLPPLVPGIHAISAFINGVSIHSQGVDLHIQYLTEVFSVEPCSGSLLGCLGGRLLHVLGAGFSPGNISAAVCGAPCQVLANATVSAFSCLVLPLDVSLAFLCNLRHAEDSCQVRSPTYLQCDLTISMGTERLPGSWPYIYLCEESSLILFEPNHWAESVSPSFSGLFLSPKVERDEVLIYNSSCNITMETEAEMECETPKQPITTKITEIQKSWGQNTQGNFSFQFCRRWSRPHSWFSQRVPHDGDSVTVETGHLLLLDANTSFLNALHIKGGKLIFMEPGPIELRAHSILITDGGELRIGSEDKPFQGKAQIKIYGSVHSTPFFPYGVKFLAVRNGTLSLHGSVPEVTVTYLQAAAHAGDTVLALGEAVDWHPGDEVVITSGMTVEGAEATEEVVVVETVRNADLHLRNPLRYSYNFRENWVAGENHILKATVALLSRNIIIQGNLTLERAKLLNSCQEANTAEGNLKHCLYSKSEKMLGARDLGARVIIQSFPEEPSLVKLKGLQFRNLGQAFHKHLSSLTLVGAMRGSYLQSCSVWDSFSRGLSMHRTWGLKVDSNIFYKIVGHAMLLGATLVHSFQSSFFPVLHGFCTSLPCLSMTVAHVEHSLSRTPPGSYLDRRFSTSENVTGRKNGWWEQGSTIRNNVIISVSGAEGLSSSEMLAPAGIYTFSPTNVIEGNRVCAAGYGYVFHLVTSQTLQAPLLSFNRNTAHSCTRYGLLVYPKFQPPWNNETGFTLFQNFMVWGSTGGAQIFRSTNLHLKNFQVYACRDFGIDILESDVNTLITDSFLLGHFTHKGSLCMSAGIKTPQRWELTISNTTFVNFDLNCVAIRTCSGCSQGQGGFTVKTRQLKFVNSSNLVAFPFPHAAVLEDLDGSLSGKNGSHVLASMETLSDTCLTNASFSQIVSGSVCGEAVLFHRMSIALANSLNVPKNLTMTDSSNKTITVNYVEDTLSNYYGWIALLLDQETYLLQFEGPWMNRSLQYSATFDSFAPGNHLLIMHRDLPPYSDILLRCGSQVGQSLPSHPLPSQDRACDWFFNRQLRQLTYLVSGEGQVKVFLQLKHGAPPSVSASTSVPESASRWSFPETWQDVEKGWGGYNHTIPGPGDDVLILPRIGLRTFYILAKPSTMKLHLQLLNFLSPNFQPSLMQVCSTESGSRLILRGAWMKNLDKTVLVDTDLPVLRCLYVMGTLDFPVDRSNVLSVACLLIAGGELKVGTLENPLEKDQRLLIFLRASEGIFCDHFEGIHVDPGTIGVYGKLRLYSAYPKKSWVHLGADIAPGNEKIIVHNAVDWQPHDTIVLSSSSYEAHEAEVLTVKEVKGHHIRIYERLKHRHIGSAHIMEDGQQVHLAAEVGLLTRNIRIQPDSPCSGRLLVGSFRKSSGEDFSGVLQLLNVEIQNMGMPLYSSIEFTGVSAGSWVISSTVHQSCSVGIHASSSHGVILNDNVVFCTNGHGIDVEGQNYSLTNNLVILTMQSANSSPWVAGIKVNYAEDIILHGNVVAGSERLGFHVSGHGCSSEVLWSDNVVHSSLHGLHLYKKHESNNCTGVSGFMAFKNFDYGAMVQTENSVDIQNITLVDNTVGLLAITYVSSALLSSVSTVQITLRNSVIVATSSSFDCIHDRKAPQSANWTSADRAPSNPRGGRIGILWPVSASEPSGWPQEPWHKVRSSHSVPGIMKLQDVTFSGFVKSCYSNDLDVCILPNEYSTGVMFPITTERTRMLRIKDKNKFYFPLLQSSRDLVGTICPTLDCEYPRKYLFTDLDGRTLGLPPPVSVFPRTEEEWTGSFLNTGIWYWFLNSQEIYCISREEQKCTFRAVIQGFFCKETEHAVLILDNVDATWTIPKSHPLVSVTNGFVDTFSIVKDSDLCSPTSSLSTFYSILPTKQMTKVCFPDQTPRFLRFLLLGNRRASKLILAVFYNEIQSPHVFLDKSFIPPTPLESAFSLLAEPAGANYFDIMNNLLYVVLQGEEPVEIYSSISIHLALTVTFSVLEKGWERAMLESLTDFFQIDPNQIRLTLEMPGNKETLEVIANSEGKRNRNCPTVTCGGPSIRYGQRRPLMAEMTSLKTTPATTLETFSKVIVIEIGDLPNIRNSEPIQSLPSNRLQRLVNQVITAQQTGALENVLGMTVGALLVTQSKGVTGYRNASSLITRNLIFTRPSELSILVQPSDGEVGIELPIQPRLVFLDEKNERVETLGLPAEPWIISVSLEGASESMLKGCTQAETRDGYVTFSRLAVLISGSNWHLVFTVISPPAGTNFTARSKAFAVLPVASKERSTIILALSLCSVTSWVALSCLVCCWLKKNKTRKIKPEDISESQAKEQKKNTRISSKPRGLQVKTAKEDTLMGEDMRMKVMQGMQSQFPRHSMDGVSKRKVSRLAVPEERTATPAPKIPRITCVPGPLAQQLTLQEPGNWQEAQQQLLRYQLAGHNQLLLSRPDLRQERKQGQEPSQLDKGSDCTGLAQEKDTCVPTEAFYLHPAPPETIQ